MELNFSYACDNNIVVSYAKNESAKLTHWINSYLALGRKIYVPPTFRKEYTNHPTLPKGFEELKFDKGDHIKATTALNDCVEGLLFIVLKLL